MTQFHNIQASREQKVRNVTLIVDSSSQFLQEIMSILTNNDWKIALVRPVLSDIPADKSHLAGRWSSDNVHFIQNSLGTSLDCSRAIQETLGHFGRIDAIINTFSIGQGAGLNERADGKATPATSTRPTGKRFAVDLKNMIWVAHAAKPWFISRGAGRILAIAARYRGLNAPYASCMELAALESACGALAREMCSSGSTVNILSAQNAEASVPATALDDNLPAEQPEAFRSAPRHRQALSGDLPTTSLAPLEAPVLWLVSEESKHMTGQFFAADAWPRSSNASKAALIASRPISTSGPLVSPETDGGPRMEFPTAVGGTSALRIVNKIDEIRGHDDETSSG